MRDGAQRAGLAQRIRSEPEIATAGAIALLWLIGALSLAVPAPFIIDGYIFQAMSDAFARNGSFFIDNGFSEYGNPSLRVHLTRIIEDRLVPQYPGAWGVLSAPFYALLGVRGLILMNALSSVLTLVLTWRLAMVLFADRRVARMAVLLFALGSFAVDYAWGVWPQALAASVAAAALLLLAEATWGARAREPWMAGLVGLILGLGVCLRVDLLFLIPPALLWLLATGQRPLISVACLAIGLLPGLALSTGINAIKFDVVSPVTYGGRGGNTDASSWLPLLPVVAAGGLAAMALAHARVRALVLKPLPILCLAGLGAAVALVLPVTSGYASDLARGFWTLVVDFQAVPLTQAGATVDEQGLVRMFGSFKKALLHSLPYLAACLLLLPRLWRGPDQRAICFCLVIAVAFIAPFALFSWHGGLAKQQRYLLTTLPLLAVLGAAAWRELEGMARPGDKLATYVFLAITIFAVALPFALGLPATFITDNLLPWAVVLTLFGMAVLLLLPWPRLDRVNPTQSPEQAASPRARVAGAMRRVFLGGVGLAALGGWAFDLAYSQGFRQLNATTAAHVAALPENTLIVTFAPERLGMRLNTPGALTVVGNHRTLTVGERALEMIRIADGEGRRIVVAGSVMLEALSRHNVIETADSLTDLPPLDDLYAVTLRRQP